MTLDSLAALERIEHDQELYVEICGIFRDDAPQIMLQLKETFRDADLSAATRHAHSLRSASANIGAADLSVMARTAENALRAGDRKNIPALFSKLDQEMSRVVEALHQLALKR